MLPQTEAASQPVRPLSPWAGRPVSRHAHVGLLIKLLQFSIWLAIGSFWPFIYVYYHSLGLSGTQIGLVVMLASLMGTFNAPLWGMLNDRLGRIRLLLSVASLGAALVCQVLGQWQHFVPILLTQGLLGLFASPIMPLLDSTTLKLLGDARDNYGAYRLWGTVGFLAGTAASSLLMGRTGLHVIFPAYGLGLLLFLLVVQRLPDNRVESRGFRLAGMSQMVRRPAWILFAVSVFILWFSVMGGFAFLGIVITEMGGTAQTVGLAAMIAGATEIPLLFYGSRLLRRYGPALLLTTAMGIYALRMLLYAWMPSVSWVPWLALLQGLSYGPFLVGAVAYAYELAPDDLKATSQGLLVSVMSMANLVAGLVGGWLFDHAGKTGLYLTLTGTCLLALGLFGVTQLWGRMRSRTDEPRSGEVLTAGRERA